MSRKLIDSPHIFEPFMQVPESEDRAVYYEKIEDDIKDLSGKILTVLDASIVEARQNKALKDLVKNEIRNFLFRYQEYCYQGKKGHSIDFLSVA